jgi:hypothetical protein
LVTTTTKHPKSELGTSHPLRDVASNLRQNVRSVLKKAGGQSGSGGTTLGGTKRNPGANGSNGTHGSNGSGGTAGKHG